MILYLTLSASKWRKTSQIRREGCTFILKHTVSLKKKVSTVYASTKKKEGKMKDMRKTLGILMVMGLLLLLSFSSVHAAIPYTINYQGYLTDSGGDPIDGTVSMVFSLYTVPTGGTALWSEIQSVSVKNGIYSV